MTAIRRIDVLGLRNLSNVQVLPGQGVNVFFGPNGSGKTSLLEAIYYMGLGRSFRSQRVESVIQSGLDEITVFSELFSGATIGVTLLPDNFPSNFSIPIVLIFLRVAQRFGASFSIGVCSTWNMTSPETGEVLQSASRNGTCF
jgi:hypothetical protein